MHTEQTKTTRRPRKDFASRKGALINALVSKYGEGAVISRKQILEICNTNKEVFPNSVVIEHNEDYRIGRGRYVVTSSDTPAKVRDSVMKAMINKGTFEADTASDLNGIQRALRIIAEMLNFVKKDEAPRQTLKLSKGVNDGKRAYNRRHPAVA
jgi:hypothetical protein